MNIVLVSILAIMALSLEAKALTDDQLAKVTFDQKLNGQVPLEATVRDEDGIRQRLGSYFGERPVILVLAYYDCPSLCTLVLNGVLEGARNMALTAGRDYEIVVLSIRPDESTNLAREKKQTYALRYGRPGSSKGWHFLTSDAATIRQVADSVGYRYEYDAASNQFAHASGITILTPSGKIARYFFGIEFRPKDLRFALVEASQNRIGSLTDRLLLLLCYHYNPATGHYGWIINRVVQVAGISTVLALGIGIACLSRKSRRPAAVLP